VSRGSLGTSDDGDRGPEVPAVAAAAQSGSVAGGSAANLGQRSPDVPADEQSGAETPLAPSVLNVANGLTVLRLVLVPVFVYFLLAGGTGARSIAFVAFAVASVTDLLDGELARRRSLITDFGKIADPIADKALTGAALIVLSAYGELPWWVTIVVLGREVLVTAIRFWVIEHGVIAASRGGKLKTLLQILAIGLYLLPLPDGWSAFPDIVMGLAVVVTVLTGFDYVLRAIRLRRSSLAAR
jgi:CDP-diacylglycerol---glycerol-3-phosphate 3-phosphatidyltransferase